MIVSVGIYPKVKAVKIYTFDFVPSINPELLSEFHFGA
jgi:hypothetical protein